MRILLVAPEPTKSRNHRHTIRLAKTLFPPLGLLTVGALTPSNVEVTLVDEVFQNLDYETKTDLVALTANTASAPRAYEIATEFRKRGVPVVMGGIHASALPEEAKQFVDAVGVGEAEGFWPQLIQDFQRGELSPIYCCQGFPSLDNLPFPRRVLINPRFYYLSKTLQTTRGCIHRCSFCCVPEFFGGGYRQRPVLEVVEEVRWVQNWQPKGPTIFVDDNIFAIRSRAAELLEKLIPLQIDWFGQASMDSLQDEEFLKLASRSGCRMLFVGLESLSDANLKDVNKPFNHPQLMKETVARLHGCGIAMLGAFITCLDEDGPDVYEKIVVFAEEAKLDAVQISILIPLPRTVVGEELAPRIFDHDYSKRDGSHIVFRPAKISPPILAEQKLQWAYGQLYNGRSIRTRLSGHVGPHLAWSRKVNRAYGFRTGKWFERLGLERL